MDTSLGGNAQTGIRGAQTAMPSFFENERKAIQRKVEREIRRRIGKRSIRLVIVILLAMSVTTATIAVGLRIYSAVENFLNVPWRNAVSVVERSTTGHFTSYYNNDEFGTNQTEKIYAHQTTTIDGCTLIINTRRLASTSSALPNIYNRNEVVSDLNSKVTIKLGEADEIIFRHGVRESRLFHYQKMIGHPPGTYTIFWHNNSSQAKPTVDIIEVGYDLGTAYGNYAGPLHVEG